MKAHPEALQRRSDVVPHALSRDMSCAMVCVQTQDEEIVVLPNESEVRILSESIVLELLLTGRAKPALLSQVRLHADQLQCVLRLARVSVPRKLLIHLCHRKQKERVLNCTMRQLPTSASIGRKNLTPIASCWGESSRSVRLPTCKDRGRSSTPRRRYRTSSMPPESRQTWP